MIRRLNIKKAHEMMMINAKLTGSIQEDRHKVEQFQKRVELFQIFDRKCGTVPRSSVSVFSDTANLRALCISYLTLIVRQLSLKVYLQEVYPS
jgi:hypothetical protein